MEIECWHDGTVDELLVPIGETVQVGTPLAMLLASGETAEAAPAPKARKARQARRHPAARPGPTIPPPAPVGTAPQARAGSPPLDLPGRAPVPATSLDIDVDTVTGTGPQGAVTITDVEHAAASRQRQRPSPPPWTAHLRCESPSRRR